MRPIVLATRPRTLDYRVENELITLVDLWKRWNPAILRDQVLELLNAYVTLRNQLEALDAANNNDEPRTQVAALALRINEAETRTIEHIALNDYLIARDISREIKHATEGLRQGAITNAANAKVAEIARAMLGLPQDARINNQTEFRNARKKVEKYKDIGSRFLCLERHFGLGIALVLPFVVGPLEFMRWPNWKVDCEIGMVRSAPNSRELQAAFTFLAGPAEAIRTGAPLPNLDAQLLAGLNAALTADNYQMPENPAAGINEDEHEGNGDDAGV